MRIFVTGASGWIGSASVTELLSAGHQVLGLARSDASAERITALGADVHRGTIDDLDALRAGAAATDGVIHLGYNHDFSRMADAAATDLAAIRAFGDELEGSNRPLVIASGIPNTGGHHTAIETDGAPAVSHPRVANADAAVALADRGVRSVVVRFAPTVHGPGDHGFIAMMTAIARDKGVSAYVGDGSDRWPAVHRLDAAKLVQLAIEMAAAGSTLHAVAEEGVFTRDIAEAIGRSLDLPTASVPADQATDHFGWIGAFFGADLPASSAHTQQSMGWNPTHPGLLEDLAAGAYVAASPAQA